jgi:exodeoxyribonuclease VII large subunit
VVTSPTGAAVRDILKVLGRRFPAVPVLICPTRVQGQGAAAEIAAAIALLSGSGRVDVIIVGRGGGSLEDLWAFNEEEVVRAIAACPVPLVSAVGHETDWVLSDLAADVRAATPSVAAELVVPDAVELRRAMVQRAQALARGVGRVAGRARERLLASAGRMRDPRLVVATHRLRLDEQARRLTDSNATRLAAERSGLAELRVRLAAHEPRARLRDLRARLAGLAGRLAAAARSGVQGRRMVLEGHRRALRGLSPLSVLERGYSLVSTPDGRLVRDAAQVGPEATIHVRPARGRLVARVVDAIPSKVKKD